MANILDRLEQRIQRWSRNVDTFFYDLRCWMRPKPPTPKDRTMAREARYFVERSLRGDWFNVSPLYHAWHVYDQTFGGTWQYRYLSQFHTKDWYRIPMEDRRKIRQILDETFEVVFDYEKVYDLELIRGVAVWRYRRTPDSVIRLKRRWKKFTKTA